jgi:1-acyl-sn-glycerol-3-phosphate acyltransferase
MERGENLFSGDSYTTPETTRHSLLYRLLWGCRFYFYFRNFFIFWQSAHCAKMGKLDQERQIFYSNKNIRLVEDCGGKIELRGLDNLRSVAGQPVILLGNHMSLLETAMFHAIVRPHLDFTFVIKKSLQKFPYFSHIMATLRAIPVSRNSPREDLKAVLGGGRKSLNEGRSIILFPQSTRSEFFEPENFNSIGIKLAKSAGVKIIPFALKTDFLGNGKLIRDLGPVHPERTIHFEFGEPMTIEGNGKEQQQQLCDFILKKLHEWHHQ